LSIVLEHEVLEHEVLEKRSMLRLTAWTRARVSTPHNAAKSASSKTFCPRRTRMIPCEQTYFDMLKTGAE
jgi:hypothetical protein